MKQNHSLANQPSLEAYIWSLSSTITTIFEQREMSQPKQQQLYIYIYTVRLSVEMCGVGVQQ